MKTKLFLLATIVTVLCGCDTPQTLENRLYAFLIFKYTDESYKELIITNNQLNHSNGDLKVIDGVANFPKRYRNEPYFSGEQWAKNPEKYTFDICELAIEEKLLSLHNGYYTYFPYTNIHLVNGYPAVIRDGTWEELCDINRLDLPILGDANSIYSEIRLFEITSLEKITHKNRDIMTIEDIEIAINDVIDHGQLDDYSISYNNMWSSRK